MADKEVGSLTSAGALDGSEILHVVQSGDSRQTTTQAIADLGGAGGLIEIHPPDTSLFSLTNLGTGVTLGTAYNADKGLSVWRSDSGSASNDRSGIIGKAVPAGGSWTAEMTLSVSPSTADSETVRVGLGLYETATGKFLGATVGGSSTALVDFHGTGLTGGLTGHFVKNLKHVPQYIRFKVVYDGTNYTFSASFDDGISYLAMSTLAKATYFTTAADRIGLFFNSFSTFTASTCRARIIYYSDPDFPA